MENIQTILYIISAIAIAMIIFKPHKFFMQVKELKPTLSDYQKVGRTEREHKGMTFDDIEKQVDELGELTEEDVIIAKNQLIAAFMGEQFKKECIVKYLDYNICGVNPKGETHLPMKYHNDWNWLMDVIEKINATHNEGIPGRDLMYTMQYLLGGGFRFSEQERKPLLFSHENIWNRVVEFIKWYKK